MDSATSLPSSAGRQPSKAALRRVLITAGPTHEPIDRVRYIGNRSSGRMGIALAQACLDRAWPVTLLLGPIGSDSIVPLSHPHLRLHRFQTVADLQILLHQHWPSHDLLFMAAAVADYRLKSITPSIPNEAASEIEAASDERAATPRPQPAAHSSEKDGGKPPTPPPAPDPTRSSIQEKLKRTATTLTLTLESTPDLLASLASITQPHQFVVGFALEPAADLVHESMRKLQSKKLDAIIANPLETMDSPNVTATLILRDGQSIAAPADMPKTEFARWLVDQIADRCSSKPS